MMNCLECGKELQHEDRVFLLCDATVYRETNVTHSAQIWDDIAAWHLDCYSMPWWKKLWLKIASS